MPVDDGGRRREMAGDGGRCLTFGPVPWEEAHDCDVGEDVNDQNDGAREDA